MADVKLTVGGRSYDVHCADGQEQQLIQLASVVDAKASGIQGGTEARQLLFAALMLADELGEKQNGDTSPQLDAARAAAALAESRMGEAQDQLQAAIAREKIALEQLDAARQSIAQPVDAHRPAHDRALLQIADRIEALADRVAQGS